MAWRSPFLPFSRVWAVPVKKVGVLSAGKATRRFYT